MQIFSTYLKSQFVHSLSNLCGSVIKIKEIISKKSIWCLSKAAHLAVHVTNKKQPQVWYHNQTPLCLSLYNVYQAMIMIEGRLQLQVRSYYQVWFENAFHVPK